MSVQWRPIPGFEGRYDVSDFGDVRSHLGSGRFGDGAKAPKFLAWNKAGEYPRARLVASDGRITTPAIHTLVLTAFVGPRPPGMGAAHLNGDHGDPRLTNLAWKTHRDEADKISHGSAPRGERNGQSKLTEAAVERIRQLPTANRRALMAELDISSQHYYRIRHRKAWPHV